MQKQSNQLSELEERARQDAVQRISELFQVIIVVAIYCVCVVPDTGTAGENRSDQSPVFGSKGKPFIQSVDLAFSHLDRNRSSAQNGSS